MARALGIVALGLVGFWLVAHLLWMGPLETAAQTTAMWALGLLTGGVGVAAIVLLAVALSVAGVAEARARRAQRRRRARLRPDRGGPRALPQHRAERRDPLGGAGHGRAGRLGRRPLVARAHPALSVTEERHGFPGPLRTLGGWGPSRGPHL